MNRFCFLFIFLFVLSISEYDVSEFGVVMGIVEYILCSFIFLFVLSISEFGVVMVIVE